MKGGELIIRAADLTLKQFNTLRIVHFLMQNEMALVRVLIWVVSLLHLEKRPCLVYPYQEVS